MSELRNHNRVAADDLPVDEALPGLGLVLDSKVFCEILQPHVPRQIDNCELLYVRYKPSTNCVVTCRISLAADKGVPATSLVVAAKCYTTGDFDRAHAKAQAHSWVKATELEPVLPFPLYGTLVFVFPNDAEIPGLDTMTNPKKLQRILYDCLTDYPNSTWRISDSRLKTEVVRYKPEKRVVVRAETKAVNRETHQKELIEVFIRGYCDDRGQQIFSTMRNLHEQLEDNADATVPRPLAYLADKHMMLVRGVAGHVLRDRLDQSDAEGALKKTALALAALHRCRPDDLPPRTAIELMSDVLATADTITHLLPHTESAVRPILRTVDQLRDFDRAPVGLVHGDFHYGQVLLDTHDTFLLDFDRTYAGDVVADVGNLCAHLLLLEIRGELTDARSNIDAFVTAYEAASASKLDDRHLALWTAFGLLQLSVRPFRTLESNWRSRIEEMLAACSEVLA